MRFRSNDSAEKKVFAISERAKNKSRESDIFVVQINERELLMPFSLRRDKIEGGKGGPASYFTILLNHLTCIIVYDFTIARSLYCERTGTRTRYHW